MATITKRNYISLSDAQEVESSATLAQLEQAEQQIDSYVGFQQKHIQQVFRGQVSSATSTSIIDTNSNTQLHQNDNYFERCVVEIIGGTGKGQIRHITSSDYSAYSITVTDAFDTTPDTTSVFKVYQLAKFPRVQDIESSNDGLTYYKAIPQPVRDAIVAQVSFIIKMGSSYFDSDASDIVSETTSKHSWEKGGKQGSLGSPTSLVNQISPRARTLLAGITNRTGEMEADTSWPSVA